MLSATSQYALRALVRLAVEPEGAAVLGRDLARECEIPANYLSKILWQLRNSGLVSTSRGSGGGYRLERQANDVRLLDVVEVFEALHTRPTCLLGKGECSDMDACSAHHAWKKVRTTFLEFLEANTIADISAEPDTIARAALEARAT